MSTIPLINCLSHISNQEGTDVTVHFLQNNTVFIDVGETRALKLRSEIGKRGTVVFLSLESLSQVLAHRQTPQYLHAYDGSTESTQPRPSTGGLNIPEQLMVYKPLPGPKWVRLFHIDRMSFKPLAPKAYEVCITGTLNAFELEQMPPYRALSYTWGSPFEDYRKEKPDSPVEITTTIICNGAVHRVTDNLFTALCYLGGAGIQGWLWIDAICINQADEEEKSCQIYEMNTIYSRAAEVLGWLGFAHVYSKDLVWATTHFLERFRSHENFASGLEWPADSLYDPQMDQFFNVDDLSSYLFRVYFFYVSCRWFRRAWVTQEAVLARRLRIFCGEFELSWQRLGAFAKVMSMTGWKSQVGSVTRRTKGCENRDWLHELTVWQGIPRQIDRILQDPDGEIFALFDIEIFSHAPGTPGRYLACFHELLIWTKMFQCLDTRDHVFSAIGLAGPDFKLAIMKLTKIDYKMTARELFITIAKRTLSSTRYLDILVDAGIQDSSLRTEEGIPSWVPNYVSNPRYGAFSCRSPKSLDAGLCGLEPSAFHLENSYLCCSGVKFDTVEEVFNLEAIPFQLDLLRFCTTFPKDINGRSRLEVLWRTLILDSSHDRIIPAPNDYGISFMAMIASRDGPKLSDLEKHELGTKDYFSCFAACLDALHALEILGKGTITPEDIREYTKAFTWNSIVNSETKDPLPQKIIEIDRLAFPYIRSKLDAIGHDCLFRTEGGFMGIYKGLCEKGDQVWALRDAHVPFVLRQTSLLLDYELVGACFMLDLMQGEMIKDAKEAQNIRLV